MLFYTLLIKGAVAQLGEHRVCNARVAGSIPVSSTIILVFHHPMENFSKFELHLLDGMQNPLLLKQRSCFLKL